MKMSMAQLYEFRHVNTIKAHKIYQYNHKIKDIVEVNFNHGKHLNHKPLKPIRALSRKEVAELMRGNK